MLLSGLSLVVPSLRVLQAQHWHHCYFLAYLLLYPHSGSCRPNTGTIVTFWPISCCTLTQGPAGPTLAPLLLSGLSLFVPSLRVLEAQHWHHCYFLVYLLLYPHSGSCRPNTGTIVTFWAISICTLTQGPGGPTLAPLLLSGLSLVVPSLRVLETQHWHHCYFLAYLLLYPHSGSCRPNTGTIVTFWAISICTLTQGPGGPTLAPLLLSGLSLVVPSLRVLQAQHWHHCSFLAYLLLYPHSGSWRPNTGTIVTFWPISCCTLTQGPGGPTLAPLLLSGLSLVVPSLRVLQAQHWHHCYFLAYLLLYPHSGSLRPNTGTIVTFWPISCCTLTQGPAGPTLAPLLLSGLSLVVPSLRVLQAQHWHHCYVLAYLLLYPHSGSLRPNTGTIVTFWPISCCTLTQGPAGPTLAPLLLSGLSLVVPSLRVLQAQHWHHCYFLAYLLLYPHSGSWRPNTGTIVTFWPISCCTLTQGPGGPTLAPLLLSGLSLVVPSLRVLQAQHWHHCSFLAYLLLYPHSGSCRPNTGTIVPSWPISCCILTQGPAGPTLAPLFLPGLSLVVSSLRVLQAQHWHHCYFLAYLLLYPHSGSCRPNTGTIVTFWPIFCCTLTQGPAGPTLAPLLLSDLSFVVPSLRVLETQHWHHCHLPTSTHFLLCNRQLDVKIRY